MLLLMMATSTLSISPSSLCPSSSSHIRSLLCTFNRRVNLSMGYCRSKSMVLNWQASMEHEEFVNSMAPFQPQSATGLFLTGLCRSNPDIFLPAVEHELEVLAENRDAEMETEMQVISSGIDMVLYRRMAELKCQERFNAVEEIIYSLMVWKFSEAGVAMIPNIWSLRNTNSAWPIQVMELECIHSLEVLQLVRGHLMLVLGKRGATKYFNNSMLSPISKMPMQEIYATSARYGYFLRRLHNRFQLEKSIKHSGDFNGDVVDTLGPQMATAMAVLRDLGGPSRAASEFLAYITSFDVETLRQFSTVRSKESKSVLDKHCDTLFKQQESKKASAGSMQLIGRDGLSEISFLRSKELVLEAVAFGSLLWDVETYVDGYYSLA